MKTDIKKITTPKHPQYKIYKDNASSFGFWIIPLVIVIISGLAYIGLKLLIQNPNFLNKTTNTSISDIKNSEIDENIVKGRQRAGSPINVNETNWGKDDPFSPAN